MSRQKTKIMAQLTGFAPLAVYLSIPAVAETANPLIGAHHTVLPDTAAELVLSNRDVNRIVCLGGKIGGYHYSEEKGALVSNAGSEAFIKFQYEEFGGEVSYVTARNEFYIFCGGVTYTLLVSPQDVVAQTVFLVPGSGDKAAANVALFSPLPEEERAVAISLGMLRDDIPQTFSVRDQFDPYAPLQDPKVDVRVRRTVTVEGTPYSAREFLLRARADVALREAMFMHTRFGASIFAITLERQRLKAGEVGRLVIVYRQEDGRAYP